MKHEFVHSNGNRRLILIFAGWAMDANPFRHVSRPGYDTLVVWDYRDFSVDWSIVAGYDEIALIAWSMGVYAASMTVHSIDHLITAKIAVNGTPVPVDDRLGIPCQTFVATADTLNERNLMKFFRRMCGDRATTDSFMLNAPSRTVEELRDELYAVYPEPWFANPKVMGWNRAVIGRQDAIFPACNQQRAWSGTPTVVLDRPHYIDLQLIADAYIIDKQHVADHFGERLSTYDENASIQKAVVDGLMADLRHTRADSVLSSPCLSALEIGCGTGILTHRLSRMIKDGYIQLWDTCPVPPDDIPNSKFLSCDAELMICRTPSERFDLIASSSTIQWFNAPARFFSECLRVLRPGGVLMISTFQRGNMNELTAAGATTLALPDADSWREMIPRAFAVLSFETQDYDLVFEHPAEVLRHLKLTGVNNLDRSGNNAGGASIVRRYPRMLDGLCHLSYRTLRIILKKKTNV